jgi:Cofilin/tropomyosin-type actin-binding protein
MSVPYVLLYYLPENCNPSLRMMYAGAVELMRSTAEVNRVIEMQSGEELEGIEKKLGGGEE